MDLGSRHVNAQTYLEINKYATRGQLTTNITSHTRGSTKRQRENKAAHNNTRKHIVKAQKTETPQTRHHQSHRIQKKLIRASRRGHHIQRKKKPTTHRMQILHR
jgi:hypothetical protein